MSVKFQTPCTHHKNMGDSAGRSAFPRLISSLQCFDAKKCGKNVSGRSTQLISLPECAHKPEAVTPFCLMLYAG